MMDLEVVLQQMDEGKVLFSERAKELSRRKEVFNKRIAKALNLTESGNSSEDKEGNDDILKINFAGEKMDIKRSALTRSNFGWNLFSCLFEKRWDRFHVRDREGRIYVDLKGKWLKPLIYCFHQNDINVDIISPNLFTNRAVEMFNRDEFKFSDPQISGLMCRTTIRFRNYLTDNSEPKIFGVFEKVSNHCDMFLKPVELSSVPLESCYTTLLYLHDNRRTGPIISRALQQLSKNSEALTSYELSHDGTEWIEQIISDVKCYPELKTYPILPLEYTAENEEIFIDENNDMGVFEVNLLGNKIFPPRKSIELQQENAENENQQS
jgi:hypothetical protein